MEALLAELQTTGLAEHLRRARWSYAAVSALHIAGIAMAFGASLPLALRLLGAGRAAPLPAIARLAVPVAAGGVALAMLTGLMLMSVRAVDYADLTVFQAKLALIGAALASAAIAHARHGLFLDRPAAVPAALHGAVSILCWSGAIACGRLIAFVE